MSEIEERVILLGILTGIFGVGAAIGALIATIANVMIFFPGAIAGSIAVVCFLILRWLKKRD